MRNRLLALAALVSLAAPATTGADPSLELVVQLAPPASGARAVPLRQRMASRLTALGLVYRGALTDGLPARSQPGGSIRSRPLPGGRANPFALDPDLVVLLEAPDAATAEAARAALASDAEVRWVEPNRIRLPGLVGYGVGAGRAGVLGALHGVTLGASSANLSPDRASSPTVFPNDPLYQDTRQWGLRNVGPGGAYGGVAGADIQALAAWTISVGDNSVLLACADTGIDPAHPDLQALLPDSTMRVDLGINVASDDPSPSYADSFGHGCPVVGVMAALTNNGVLFDSLGAAGVCGGDGGSNFGCRIVPIKISPGHEGYSTSFDIARAMLYSASVGARAMNLSFAGDEPSALERLALYDVIRRGCVVVTAAGNSGFDEPTKPWYPAAYAAEGLCIQVGATDEFDARTLFSSYGPGLDLVAPGVDIWTTFMTYPSFFGAHYPGYVAAAGTSFASPFVAGVVGLLAAARPELTDVDFQHLIRESAKDIGAPGVDPQTGWGRLDAAKALKAIPPTFGVWHDEVQGQTFQVLDSDTLVIESGDFATFDRYRGRRLAERIEVTATVAIPDSFVDSVRVWPRVGGTFTLRGGYHLPYFTPWAEVTSVGPTSFTLRGYLYRVEPTPCAGCTAEDRFVPMPPGDERFGFTVIGKVARPPLLPTSAPAVGPPRARLLLSPNPSRDRAWIAAPGAGRLLIMDIAGRVVCRASVPPSGEFVWDGRDRSGHGVAPGLYLVRFEGEHGTLERRLVRLSP